MHTHVSRCRTGHLRPEQGHVEGLTFPGLASTACAGAVVTCTTKLTKGQDQDHQEGEVEDRQGPELTAQLRV